MLQVTMRLEGAVLVRRRFEARADALANVMKLAGPAIDVVFERILARQFATEGGHAGAPWKPLAMSTQADRRRQGFAPAHPILVRTGTLKRSLTGKTGDTITLHSPKLYVRGTADPKFVYHQSTRPRKKIPRRAMAAFTADDRHELLRPVVLAARGLNPSRTPRQEARHGGTLRQGPG